MPLVPFLFSLKWTPKLYKIQDLPTLALSPVPVTIPIEPAAWHRRLLYPWPLSVLSWHLALCVSEYKVLSFTVLSCCFLSPTQDHLFFLFNIKVKHTENDFIITKLPSQLVPVPTP